MARPTLRQQLETFFQRKGSLDPFELPIFPLNAVLFPGGLLPLRIFEQRYMDMIKACLKNDRPFGVALIKDGSETGAATTEEVGCVATVVDWDMQELGILNVKALGVEPSKNVAEVERFVIADTWILDGGLMMAKVNRVSAEPATELATKNQRCAQILQQIIERLGPENFNSPLAYDDAVWVSYRLAEVLPLKLLAKQQMLEMNDPAMRIEILHNFLIQQGLAN